MKAIDVEKIVAIDARKKGMSVNRPTASNAIAIQDIVKLLNGSGLQI